MTAARAIATRLCRLPQKERNRMIAALPPSIQGEVEAEIQVALQFGFDRLPDADVQALLNRLLEGAPMPPKLAPREHWIEELRSLPADSVAAALERCPSGFISLVLQGGDWPWAGAVRAQLRRSGTMSGDLDRLPDKGRRAALQRMAWRALHEALVGEKGPSTPANFDALLGVQEAEPQVKAHG